MKSLPFIAALLIAAPAPVFAASAAPAPAKPLHFDQIGTVRNWQAGGDNIVYVQGTDKQWYKAVMFETCMTLNTKNGVHFQTETDPATNQKVSKVEVDHHICTVDTLTKVDAPPAQKTSAK